ncbi:toxin-activating lysine-acyltransferase [Chitinolyticbacter meiyuanensis]|uniref:toxin-activating lysine-acyltransferase n=1 Tax=Chitinolyticbacter meiyuanensis TaxID=682798 RepID=UPI0011E58AD6|nr:toxin-activating lysine-acyltransferase [Chitinolyticbacter meiyuanensis]
MDDSKLNDYATRFCQTLGYVTFLRTRAGAVARPLVDAIPEFLDVALHHEQCEVFIGPGGWPCAYVIWAWLAPDVEQRLAVHNKHWLHEMEWNESRTAWVLDCVVLDGQMHRIRRELRQRLPQAEGINWIRYTAEGQVSKVVRSRRRSEA